MFIIARRYGPCYGNMDFLIGWDEKHGTVASGDVRRAMRFRTREEAEAAKYRAACALMMSDIRVELREV